MRTFLVFALGAITLICPSQAQTYVSCHHFVDTESNCNFEIEPGHNGIVWVREPLINLQEDGEILPEEESGAVMSISPPPGSRGGFSTLVIQVNPALVSCLQFDVTTIGSPMLRVLSRYPQTPLQEYKPHIEDAAERVMKRMGATIHHGAQEARIEGTVWFENEKIIIESLRIDEGPCVSDITGDVAAGTETTRSPPPAATSTRPPVRPVASSSPNPRPRTTRRPPPHNAPGWSSPYPSHVTTTRMPAGISHPRPSPRPPHNGGGAPAPHEGQGMTTMKPNGPPHHVPRPGDPNWPGGFFFYPHTQQSPVCPKIPLRLHGGNSSSGLVEVCINGTWGTVCNDGWTAENSRVVCNSLGFINGTIRSDLQVLSKGPIFLDGVRCKRHDHILPQCCHNEIGVHDCTHAQDVVLTCFNTSIVHPPPRPPPPRPCHPRDPRCRDPHRPPPPTGPHDGSGHMTPGAPRDPPDAPVSLPSPNQDSTGNNNRPPPTGPHDGSGHMTPGAPRDPPDAPVSLPSPNQDSTGNDNRPPPTGPHDGSGHMTPGAPRDPPDAPISIPSPNQEWNWDEQPPPAGPSDNIDPMTPGAPRDPPDAPVSIPSPNQEWNWGGQQPDGSEPRHPPPAHGSGQHPPSGPGQRHPPPPSHAPEHYPPPPQGSSSGQNPPPRPAPHEGHPTGSEQYHPSSPSEDSG